MMHDGHGPALLLRPYVRSWVVGLGGGVGEGGGGGGWDRARSGGEGHVLCTLEGKEWTLPSPQHSNNIVQ